MPCLALQYPGAVPLGECVVKGKTRRETVRSMGDKLVRAMTDAGAFRVLAVDATTAANVAREAHGLAADAADALSRLMSGSLLIRSTIHPNDRLQVTMGHNGRLGDLAVDAWPDGRIRGRVLSAANKNPKHPPVGDVGVVEVARTRRGMTGSIRAQR